MLSSDTSAEELPVPPVFQQPAVVVVNLDSSIDELPDLNVTQEFPLPLHHQVLREAYVLLERLQDPPQRPLTPPPELEVDWEGLEAALADFDAPQPLILQQPEVVPQPQFVPLLYVQPQPLPQVDWAMVAYALFIIAEQEHQQ